MTQAVLNTLLLAICITTQAQQLEPVKWKATSRKIDSTEYEIKLTGAIENEWHVFSQFTDTNGSLPTELQFENVGIDFELVGITEEGLTFTTYNHIFDVEETYFVNQAEFNQRIKLRRPDVRQIKISMSYQACNEVCITRVEQLIVSLDGAKVVPESVTMDTNSELLSQNLRLDLKNKELLKSSNEGVLENGSPLNVFLLGFLGGLVALLTPCVFPMIPLTVSFFTKQSQKKSKGIGSALLYGAFIFFIYIALSIPFHFLDAVNPEILNTIATNVWLNIFFFVVFIIFAFSFFGYFELTLPHSWVNSMDKASSARGAIGIFFMALTLALVSFSCTGPILGSLLAGSLTASGGAFQLTMGMAGFGAALALPFGLFALFPNLLSSLPKSGGWLTTIKVVLGFMELALAFKFLSNADLVAHWGFLKREVFIGIWVIIFLLLALYFFGILRFPHDGRKKRGLGKIISGLIVSGFVIYLATGLQRNTSLTILSGFPPPSFYSLYDQSTDCPLGLHCYKDFDKGLSYAKTNNKPILLDFTGWACVNCRKMEENVWSNPRVFEMLKNEFVLISLYIDDRRVLEENEKFNFKVKENQLKAINTIGEKWATFQYVNFKTASQPYYVTMSPNLELLNTPKQFTGIQPYYQWLRQSLDRNAN